MASFCRPALLRKSLAPLNTRSPATGIYNTLRPRQSGRTCSIPLLTRLSSTVTDSASTGASIPQPATISSTTTPPPPTKSRTRRTLSATALILVFTALGFTMAVAPAAASLNEVFTPPTDAETLFLYKPPTPRTSEIDNHIKTCTLATTLRQNPEYVECRPHLKIPEPMRNHNLTGGTLLGEDKIAVPPLSFLNADAELPSLVQISYLGPSLCGHPGIIHGGLLATLLDEGLARACFPALPNKVGVTASLTINYKKPCPSDAFVVLRAETTKVDGRKAWVKGWIERLNEDGGEGERLVEAEALFIEPRGAKNMARIYSPAK